MAYQDGRKPWCTALVAKQFGSIESKRLPAQKAGGLYKFNCHQHAGRSGYVSFQIESPLRRSPACKAEVKMV